MMCNSDQARGRGKVKVVRYEIVHCTSVKIFGLLVSSKSAAGQDKIES